MTMRTHLLFTAAVTFCGTISAQGVITRMNAGQATFRYDGNLAAVIEEADLALGTDTIIMGGGTYALPADLLINSPVVIIGTGFRADSSATYNGGRTVITTPSDYRIIRFLDGADGSELHGLAIRGSIEVRLGQNLGNSAVDGFRVKRCDMDNLLLGPGSFGSNATNAIIEESVIDVMDMNEASNPLIRSCFIRNLTGAIASSNATVENCTFLGYQISTNTNVTYRNCIFGRNSNAAIVVNEASTFVECVFAGNGTSFSYSFGAAPTDGGGNQSAAYFAGASPNAVFPNILPANVVASFNNYVATNNYHVGTAWATAGLGGTEVGVYGGSSAWKDGSIPFNPHWRELTQTGSTSSGVIPGVTIKGSAQTH